MLLKGSFISGIVNFWYILLITSSGTIDLPSLLAFLFIHSSKLVFKKITLISLRLFLFIWFNIFALDKASKWVASANILLYLSIAELILV